MVGDGAFSHKIHYVTILNLEGHPNCITGLKVMAISLNGWILPIDGDASGRVFVCSLRIRLVFIRTVRLRKLYKIEGMARYKGLLIAPDNFLLHVFDFIRKI